MIQFNLFSDDLTYQTDNKEAKGRFHSGRRKHKNRQDLSNNLDEDNSENLGPNGNPQKSSFGSSFFSNSSTHNKNDYWSSLLLMLLLLLVTSSSV